MIDITSILESCSKKKSEKEDVLNALLHKLLPEDKLAFIATNLSTKNAKSSLFILKIHREYIELLERNKNRQKKSTFFIQKKELQVNGQRLSPSFLSDFSKRIYTHLNNKNKSELIIGYQENPKQQ